MIKDRLKSLGLTHTALAERLGVDRTTINRRVAADSPELAAWLDALEVLTPEERTAWLNNED